LQQYEEALTDYNQALKMNKDNTHALAHRGIILRKKKQYKEALADFNQALALGYSRPWIRKELEELHQLIRGNRR
jgi:tetratricopeptide (TPR) repeat protein